MNTINISVVLAFFAVVCVVGLITFSKAKSRDAFFLGSSIPASAGLFGRGIAIFVMTNGAFFGDMGTSFDRGIQYGLLSNLGLVIMHIIFAYVFYKKTALIDSLYSPGDVISHFYGEIGRAAAGVCSAILGLAYIAIQLHALGCFCEQFLYLDYKVSIVVFTAGIVIYTSSGGFCSILKTRTLYFMMAVFALFLLIFFALQKVGGFQELEKGLPPGHMKITLWKDSGLSGIIPFILYLFPIIDPGSLQYLLAAQHKNKTKAAFFISALSGSLIWFIPTFLGVLLRFAYPNATASFAFDSFIQDYIPVALRGLVFTGILAIFLSTIDIFFHTTGVSLVRDLITPMTGIKLSVRAELNWTRVCIIILGTVSACSLLFTKSFTAIESPGFSVFAPVVGVPITLVILGIRGHPASFYIGILAGVLANFIWKGMIDHSTNLDACLPATVANLLAFFAMEIFLRPFQDLDIFSDQK